VNLSLTTLVEELDDLFFERATRAFRMAAGVQRDMAPVPELPEVVRLEAWQVTSEVMSSPRVDEAKRARLVLLRRHLARASVEAQLVEADARLTTALAGQTFFAAAKTWTAVEAQRELPRLASREHRVALSTELSNQLGAQGPLVARRLDRLLESLAALKLSPDAWWHELHGREVGPRLEAAQQVLSQTADPAVDLLAFALKKLDPQLTPRAAAAHDAERALLAPWLFESFRREDLKHAVTRCLTDLGFTPNAEGRITLDTEARPGRDPNPHVFELRVPDQVRLLLTPDAGVDTYAGWLSAWGTALHRAHVARGRPFVERRLGDRAVIAAVGLVFESFLFEEGWLRRYLRLTNHQAREAARVFAFRQLAQLRRAAVVASYSAEALRRGSWSSLTDDYVPRFSSALGVEVPRGAALFEIDAFGDALVRLDAYALEHRLRGLMRERFNEDFWRNPATGRWLMDLASRGQQHDAPALTTSLGLEAPSLAAAAQERVALMGA
jgi:hypothetical protein